MNARCESCGGTGDARWRLTNDSPTHHCPDCNGTGLVPASSSPKAEEPEA